MYLCIGCQTIRQNHTCNHPSIVKLPYHWRSSQVLWTRTHSRPSSANCTELILRMDVHRRRRTIPREQRGLMLQHSQQTRLRLAQFARQFGVSARDLRHLYVYGHMPIAMWQRFLAERVPIPRGWIRAIKERADGHCPWTFVLEVTRPCLACSKMELNPDLIKPLPPPYWQVTEPIPKY